ncbi:hypothetical protein CJA_2761 [Cellvibrio japonicus Ueda107]|uniref:Uncharacterized protein n=1 Tax=Cellvibrio japonicus (strain Ueda107) TaxID=498211 RepID=B3PBJ4_CELJU|nr:hypothetical protein CJA_2761 [Cellvibrio japonicus Ueda107]
MEVIAFIGLLLWLSTPLTMLNTLAEIAGSVHVGAWIFFR